MVRSLNNNYGEQGGRGGSGGVTKRGVGDGGGVKRTLQPCCGGRGHETFELG